MRIDQVVRRTGLTSRTLRYYEARGLLAPLRTDSNRRVYGADDLERIHRIVILKQAGLNLAQIGRIFDRSDIDIESLLRQQLETLVDQAAEIEASHMLLQGTLDRIQRGDAIDAESLCALIRDADRNCDEQAWKTIVGRYYSPEEQARWQSTGQPAMKMFDDPDYREQWETLAERIESALPLDPEGKAALSFVREWFALLEPFSRIATREMWDQSAKIFEAMPEWEDRVEPPFSSRVWQFILAATGVALSAGKDIGPVPAWMQTAGERA